MTVFTYSLAVGCGQLVTLDFFSDQSLSALDTTGIATVLQNISRKCRRRIAYADTTVPSLILVEKPARQQCFP